MKRYTNKLLMLFLILIIACICIEAPLLSEGANARDATQQKKTTEKEYLEKRLKSEEKQLQRTQQLIQKTKKQLDEIEANEKH
ncbi:peptidoglycan hydrolase CwlO-like protein [Dysgonomonas sp. PH5-45]|uniref:hypothetical protein n=1 Tax=unclassified Dysgonomonas TaxID=2630389 RepID=UPI002475F761|nr:MULTISPECIES: hypothetical protein [unclassified Dysgonomonas]MDH6355736.1 peptidoglycan hydrolase CwlO-like protein [Dysgonomonas sp. PH5-45]MDH6388633.1 peptidoglycan hydrolase CwlO-like protein [Dysgonomonas sp. PH5-37]